MSNIDTVIDYHDRSKHHFDRYARSAGQLDWANQPSPYRRYPGVKTIRLPLETSGTCRLFDELYEPSGGAAPIPITLDSISGFLRNSLAISAWKQHGDNRWALRVNPSSGCLHPTEAYLAMPQLEDRSEDPMLLHYLPRTHALEHRATFRSESWRRMFPTVGDDCFLVGLSSICWREAWKYGERAFRYCQHDVGHAVAALRFSAANLGWKLEIVPGFSSMSLAALLGLDRTDEFDPGEPEESELLALVSPVDEPTSGESIVDLDEDLRQQIREGDWFGRPNQLSRGHVAWEANDVVAAATRQPPGVSVCVPPTSDPDAVSVRVTAAVREDLEAREIIQQRRSCLALDGESSISLQGMLHILARTMPGPHPPWDALNRSPRLHLVLFVHRVEGLAPGIYAFVREGGLRDRLKQAMRAEFAWETPDEVPSDFPLYLLMQGSFQDVARTLSCHQEIASDGFFSVAMLADFEGSLREQGAWSYRNLFWEAGMIGQVLYLEAEAAGVGSTGIGCFFDNEVHDLLGLAGHTYQDLYHFTVGMPVEDVRIETLPAYGELER